MSAIFGFPDDVKLKSYLPLFSFISEPNAVFALVLNKVFDGRRDDETLQLLKKNEGKQEHERSLTNRSNGQLIVAAELGHYYNTPKRVLNGRRSV